MSDSLSTIDVAILEELQRDSSRSTADLAEKVGLSQSPCWRRLQRLKDEGYIAREVAIVNRNRFGSNIVIFADLKFAAMSDEMRAELHRKIEITGEIAECYTVFGDNDMIIKVLAESMNWYQNFYYNTLMKLPGIMDVKSSVTLSEVKYTTAIPFRKQLPSQNGA